MEIKEILGDYESYFNDTLTRLKAVGIDITGYPMSHLGFRTDTFDEYEKVREEIKSLSNSFAENIHNNRPIAKLLLREPLQLPGGFTVDLIELMPPKESRSYLTGLEHCGVVIGEGLEEFAEQHKDVMTDRQDQGQYCKPYFIKFDNNTRVKFYDLSLQNVVELEGTKFISL